MSSITTDRAAAKHRPDLMPFERFLKESGIGRTRGYALARSDSFPFSVLKLGSRYYVSRRAYERWLDGDRKEPSDAA